MNLCLVWMRRCSQDSSARQRLAGSVGRSPDSPRFRQTPTEGAATLTGAGTLERSSGRASGTVCGRRGGRGVGRRTNPLIPASSPPGSLPLGAVNELS